MTRSQPTDGPGGAAVELGKTTSFRKGLPACSLARADPRLKRTRVHLVELLVVIIIGIIIIGILAAIAIPVFLNQRTRAVDASIKSDLKNVATQMETYFAEKQAYPAHGYGTDPAAGTAGADFTNKGQTIALTKNNKVQSWPVNASKVLAGTYCLIGGSWYQGSMSVWLT